MAKVKTCSFCNKETKLFYANPKCCADFKCRKLYNESKKKNGTNSSDKKKYTKIKPVSDKKQKELAIYRKLRDSYLNSNPNCEICGTSRNLTLHHKKTRQYHLCDVGVFMTLCFSCHERVHREDKWARDNGYLLNSR